MAYKRLIIVVDSAADLGFHWQTIFTNYLEKIIRYFNSNGSISQDPCASKPILGLVVYGSQGPYSEPLVQPSGWTSDLDTFLQWLSALSFTSCEFSEAAVAKGLSRALKTIEETKDDSEAQIFGHSHCILVASSNSFPIINPLKLPEDQILDYGKVSVERRHNFFPDAMAVAKDFVQSFVSLSVISPKYSPVLQEIYKAGNVHNNKHRTECSANDDENLKHLFLLSENFTEAYDVLGYFGVVPAAGNHQGKGTELGTYLIPPPEEKMSDEGMQMTGDIVSEALPISEPETCVGDILAAIEQQLEEDTDDDEALRTNQLELFALNRPTSAEDIIYHERFKELMLTLEEVLDRPETSLQNKHEKDNAIKSGLVPSESTMSLQEMTRGIEVDDLQSLDPDAMTSNNQRQGSLKSTSQIEDGFGNCKLQITPNGFVLSQNDCITSPEALSASPLSNSNYRKVLRPTESQTNGCGTMFSFEVNPGAWPITPQSSKYAMNCSGRTQNLSWTAPSTGLLDSGNSTKLPEAVSASPLRNSNSREVLRSTESQTNGCGTMCSLEVNPEAWPVTPQSSKYAMNCSGRAQNPSWTAAPSTGLLDSGNSTKLPEAVSASPLRNSNSREVLRSTESQTNGCGTMCSLEVNPGAWPVTPQSSKYAMNCSGRAQNLSWTAAPSTGLLDSGNSTKLLEAVSASPLSNSNSREVLRSTESQTNGCGTMCSLEVNPGAWPVTPQSSKYAMNCSGRAQNLSWTAAPSTGLLDSGNSTKLSEAAQNPSWTAAPPTGLLDSGNSTKLPEAVSASPLSNSNSREVLRSTESQTNGCGTMCSLEVNPGAWPVTPQSSKYALNCSGRAQNPSWTAGGYRNPKNWETSTNFWGSSSARKFQSSKTIRHFPREEITESEHRVKRRLTNAFGQSSRLNSTGIGNGVGSSEREAKALPLTNAFRIGTSLSQYASRGPPGYIKAWEGDLTVKEKGDTIVINRLVVYRKKTTSETLFINWPDRMHMDQFIPKAQADNMRFDGQVEYLFLEPVNRRSKLDQLVEKNLCAYIRLPEQTLILYNSPEELRFVGTLHSGVWPVPSHTMFSSLQ